MHLLALLLLAHAAHSTRREALLQQGRTRDAHALFQTVVREEPKNGAALAYLGFTTLQLQHDVDAAVDMLERAVKLESGERPRPPLPGQRVRREGAARQHLHRDGRGREGEGRVRARRRAGPLVGRRADGPDAVLPARRPASPGARSDKARRAGSGHRELDAARGFLAQAVIARKEGATRCRSSRRRCRRRATTRAPRSTRATSRLCVPVGEAHRRGHRAVQGRRRARARPGNPLDSLGEGYSGRASSTRRWPASARRWRSIRRSPRPGTAWPTSRPQGHPQGGAAGLREVPRAAAQGQARRPRARAAPQARRPLKIGECPQFL